jgi:hypothetical protein
VRFRAFTGIQYYWRPPTQGMRGYIATGSCITQTPNTQDLDLQKLLCMIGEGGIKSFLTEEMFLSYDLQSVYTDMSMHVVKIDRNGYTVNVTVSHL